MVRIVGANRTGALPEERMSTRIRVKKTTATPTPASPKARTVETFADMFDSTFKEHFSGGTWAFWRIVAKAIFAEPLTPEELAVFTRHTGRTVAQSTPAREVWLAIGRRGGKDWFTAALLVYLACYRSYQFKKGELGRVMLLAVDADQADILFEYTSALIDSIPECRAMVTKRTVKYGMRRLQLSNRIELLIKPADKRRVRGRTVLACVCDEIAHWWSDERHANPDSEVLKALRPSMLGVPGAILVCISSPFRRQGTMFDADQKHWGRNNDRVLFIRAATWEARPVRSEEHREMFPTFEAELAEEKANDPSSFASEYGAEYRLDLEDYLSLEAVNACVIEGRDGLPFEAGREHRMFLDTAGGSGQDSLAACISKTLPGGTAVVVRLFERKPRFDAETVADEIAEWCAEYGIAMVHGDNFSGDTWASMLRKRGLSYTIETRNASALYRAFAPVVTGKKVELPDPRKSPTVERGLNQLVNLVKRQGGEKITHALGEHDDVANALAGGVLLSIKPPSGFEVKSVTKSTLPWHNESEAKRRMLLAADPRGETLPEPVHCRCNIPITDGDRIRTQCLYSRGR